MDFDSIVKKRKSARSFKSSVPSWKDILLAIDAALQGPYAGNINNLKFLIVENKDTIKKIAKHCDQIWIEESGLLIIALSDDRNLENMYGERGRVYSRQQAGAAIQTILLKLTDLNIDSCWTGAYTDELIRQILDIPQHIQIEAIIPTGYEQKDQVKVKPSKKELDSVLQWERWEQYKRPSFFEESPDKYALRSS